MKKTIYCKNINYSRAGKYFSRRLYETAAQAGISLMLILVLILGISIESSAANPKLNNQQVYVNSNPLSPSEMELPPPYDPIYSPECGIYFSYQFWNEWPPLPANIWNRPFWDLGNGIYLLDDIDFNYVELSSQTSPLSSSPSSLLSVTDNVYENIYHPYLTNVTASLSAPYTTTLQFTATGGMENVNYGIFSSTNGLNWNLEEYTQTGESHTYTNISQNQKLYALAHPEIITWGNAYSQNTELPTGIINAVELSCGMDNGLALLGDGSLEAWGNSAWDLNTVPDGLTNVSMITSGWQYHVALKQDGTVTSWGITNIPWMSLNPCAVPEGLTNVIQVSALALHTLALKTDGTVIGWGDAEYGKTTIPTGLTNVIAVSAGIQHSLAL